ncbi:hypothetical protein KUCAC02_016273 [Chaenocephalus aceratus]|uniref:Uncharacterized protein n=1 Tax=Chaenocephalus aceratus TaxID=36190 RepID=A0ACB9Y2C4_CHAAC|nr:hypothetical protein KUCAC02_016273 [Chaenocephalus aceratus]
MEFLLPMRSRDRMASPGCEPLLDPPSSCTRHQYHCVKRKLRPGRILGFIISMVAVCTFCSWSALSLVTTVANELESSAEGSAEAAGPQRTLLQYHNHTAKPEDTPVAMRLSTEDMNHGDYPTDYFSVEDRPLTVITEKLQISDDVAGATFMAAGGSAPELFTSVIGVFVSHSNVGIGTIVGSAVFNILFVIGMCAVFSREAGRVKAKIEFVIKTDCSNQVDERETAPKAKPRLQREGSCASLHNSLMRNSIFQLMIHTLDPLSDEGRFKEKASILHKMAKQKCKEDAVTANGVADKNIPNSSNVAVEVTPPSNGGDQGGDDEQPLSLAWPDTNRKRITYLVILPIILPLWLTLPDVRREASARFFPVTFIGAISWIAFFSYLMVWWAHQVGETFWITEEIMGLTILAAGTSIPDLITSVIVARKGLGDMAVSSSVGSNIFDITVGLPFPWLIYHIINDFKPIQVSSNGLFCAIVLLFLMLLFVIVSIAACKWKMSKFLGFLMFLLYIVFLVLSVMLEDKIITCPITV